MTVTYIAWWMKMVVRIDEMKVGEKVRMRRIR